MDKPKIQPTADNLSFWEGCRDHKLLYQACNDCGAVQLIPRNVCTQCQGSQLAWRESAGQGVVLSYTKVYRAPVPAFKPDTPYLIVLVDLDEGFRLMLNVQNDKEVATSIGQRVRIAFEARGDCTVPIAQLEPS